jgi:hypothetical protein
MSAFTVISTPEMQESLQFRKFDGYGGLFKSFSMMKILIMVF